MSLSTKELIGEDDYLNEINCLLDSFQLLLEYELLPYKYSELDQFYCLYFELNI